MQLLQISASDLQIFSESPEELLRESEEIQIAVATFPETPRSLLAVLVNSDYSSVVEVARLHVNFAGEIAGNYREIVAEVLQNLDLGQNDRLAVELMKFAPVSPDFLSEWVPVSRLIQGLHNEYMPLRYRLQLLERLAVSEKLEARLVVAESSEAPVTLLELLAGDLELAVRLTVECNGNCALDVVELVKSQHDLAGNWDAEVERLRELGESRWSWIRLKVAENPFAPEDVLMKLATDKLATDRLATDKLFRVRLAVAKNPNTTARVLGVLAESDKEIQIAVVEHPNTGEEILHRLFSGYKHLIQRRDHLPASILERFFRESAKDVLDEEHEYRYLLLNQVNIPTWILAELANVDIEELTAKATAKKDSSPILETLEDFFEMETIFLTNIARHPQVSTEILEHLTQYPNSNVQLAIAENPKTPEELRISLLEQLSVNSNVYIKVKIASNPQTPIAVLEQLANKSYKLDGTEELLRELTPDLTPNLLKQIKTFIYKGQSPEMILFGLEQFSADSLVGGEWTNLINYLDESERKTLEYLSNQESPLEWEARFTVETRSERRREPSFSDDELAKNYNMLDGLMHLVNTQYNRDRTNQEILAALLGNPSVPALLRERLWERYKTTPDDESEYLEDWDMRLALAYNPQISEQQRINYLKQLLSYEVFHFGWYMGENINQKIAKNPQTPKSILEFIARNILDRFEELPENPNAHIILDNFEDVLENPNAPVDILREAAQLDIPYIQKWIVKNPNTPKDLLEELSSSQMSLKNPNLTPLDIYKIHLEKQSEQETEKAQRLMSKRDSNQRIFRQSNQQSPTLQSLPRLYNPSNDDLPTLLTEYAQSNNAFVRFVTLLHPITPGEILNQAANSASWLERYAVAENESTSSEIRSRLARDGNRIVRAAANYYL
ncbi:MAG: hypothetical protein WBA41_05955 [Rivularia sp. (in: cyanobacteria)]